MRVPAAFAITALAFALSACVFVPRVNERDAAEAECKTFTQSMSLDVIAIKQHVDIDDILPPTECHREDCAARHLAALITIPAGSALISGSIVLAGNSIHWLEYQGTCSDGYLGKTKRLFLETFSKEKTVTTRK